MHREAASGLLSRPFQGVYVVGGSRPTWEQLAVVGHLWLGTDSAASHGSAAVLHGLYGFAKEPPIHLSVVGSLRGRKDPRFVMHKRGPELRDEIGTIDGIRVTSPRWTLLDLAGIRHPRLVESTDALIRRRKTSVAQLWVMLMDPRLLRRHGRGRLLRVVEERTPQAHLSDSDMELELDRHLRARGESAILQFPIRLPSGIVVHPDLVFPDEMVAIETDGRLGHLDRFDQDRARDRQLMALGWMVIRVTWVHLRFDTDAVIDEICQVLADRRRLVARSQGNPS